MSSSNKTSLGLNLWSGSDKPKRVDFCSDNEIIDNELTSHFQNLNFHVSDDDRARWDKNVFYGVYAGNGSSSQTITTKCPFTPSAVIVFAHNVTPYVWDTSSNQGHSYFGFSSPIAASYGVKLDPSTKTIRVTQQITSIKNEVISLNESSVIYCYLMFR